MSDGDDDARSSGREQVLHDGFDPTSHSLGAEQAGARWRSWTSPLPVDEVQRRLSAVPDGGAREPFTLTRTKVGFLLRWTSRRKTLIAEVTLAAWEEGTQIHVAVPDESKATEKQLAGLQGVLSSLVD